MKLQPNKHGCANPGFINIPGVGQDIPVNELELSQEREELFALGQLTPVEVIDQHIIITIFIRAGHESFSISVPGTNYEDAMEYLRVCWGYREREDRT